MEIIVSAVFVVGFVYTYGLGKGYNPLCRECDWPRSWPEERLILARRIGVVGTVVTIMRLVFRLLI